METNLGISGFIASVILVAVLYVFATAFITMYTRRKEYAVLLAMVWRPQQSSRMILTEALILGTAVAMVSWTILGWISVTHDVSTSPIRVFLIGVFGLAIYLLGAMIPAVLVTKIKPYEAIQNGDVSRRVRLFPTRNRVSMAFNQLAGLMEAHGTDHPSHCFTCKSTRRFPRPFSSAERRNVHDIA